jgi:hypothetical protein
VGSGQLGDEWAAFARSPERDHFYWAFNLREFLRLLPPPGRLTVDIAADRDD